MSGVDVVHVGPDRFRIAPWRGEAGVALVSPIPGTVLHPTTVTGCVELLARRGVREVVTGALAAPEVPAFLAAGFAVREHLHLLAHDLTSLPASGAPVRLRRARRGDRPTVLQVDGAAFDDFWRLDDAGLDDAIDATASSRFRVAVSPAVVGYLVTGRAADRGYLQRLAVRPDRQRLGIATALVVDGLRWLRRHGASEAVVNTQEGNRQALTLYEHLGFRLQRDGLSVLARPTGP